MSSTQHKSLARSIEQWQNCDPHAMATRQSDAAIENAFVDAKHDVLALSTEVAALKAQRDELVEALKLAYITMQHMGNILNNIDAVDEEEDAQHDAAFEAVASLIAKHAGSAS